MSRPLRLHAPGLLHHVFARGNDKACIFADDEDCESFLELLAKTLPRFSVRCVAYCLLWNHYHLLLVPDAHPVSRLLQQLNSTYCQRFNRRHNRVGHLLQGRFGCRIVEDGAYARTVLRYLALNPVSAGRVTRPEEWRWSSYRFAVGHDEVPDFLSCEHMCAAFGTSDNALARARFAEFVLAGLRETFTNSLLHGSDRLAETLAPELEPHKPIIDFVYAHRCAARPSLGTLLDGCTGVALENAVHAAFHQHAYTLTEIAGALGCDPSTVCRRIQRTTRRKGAADARSSSPEDDLAKNKI